MPYVLKASGTSYITAPTLGNLLTATTVKVKSKQLIIVGNDCYWFSQATFAERELAFYISGSDNVIIYAGDGSGGGTVIGARAAVFGTTGQISLVNPEFTINMSTGAYTLSHAGGVLSSGTVTVGTTRNANTTLFRLGARGSSSTSGVTDGTGFLKLGSYLGDTEVYINGALVREYPMPSAGTVITDTVSAQNGALRSPSGNDWAFIPNPSTRIGLGLGIGV